VRGSLAFEATRPQWLEGLRVATAMTVPLVVGWVLRRPELVWAGLGGWLTMLSDPGGPYPTRAAAMGTFALMGALATFAGGLAGLTPWAAIPTLFTFAMICSLIRVHGDTAATIGVLALTMVCITEGSPAHLDVSLVRAGLFLSGSLFAILLAVAFWPFRPYYPVRAAVAASWMAVGDVAAAAAKVASSPADAAKWESLVPLRRRARETLEDAREALAVARAGRHGETGRGFQLLVLYEILELLLGDLAALLEALRAGAERDEPLPPHAGEALADVSRALYAIAEAVVEEGPTEAVVAPRFDASLNPAVLFSRVEDEIQQALHSVEALRRGGPGPRQHEALSFPEEAPSLRDAFAKGSTELHHALRVALVATLAQLLATALRLERSYWVTVTVVLVLQPHAIATVRRALQRAGGTVIGGLIAALIARHLREPLALGGVLFALAWIAVAVRRMNYALFATLVTPVFVLLAETNAGAGHLTRVRILDTLLGGALALAGAIALWPTRDLDRMPTLIAAILRADRVYLDAVLHGQGPAGTVAARRRVGLATANAEAALQRLIAEALPPARVEPLMALVAYGRRLSASITAVGAAPPSPQYAARLEGILDALADAAQSGAPPPPVPPLDNPAEPEPAQRLARQLRVVQSALARLG
jgi:uncharacterized membrane protein YccC